MAKKKEEKDLGEAEVEAPTPSEADELRVGKEKEKTKKKSGKEVVKKETKPKTAAKSAAVKKSKKEKPKLSKEERRHSKKYREVSALVDKDKHYSYQEGIELIKKTSVTKFDSSVEIHIRLGVNPSASDQQIRGTVVLPGGTGKQKKVAVVCSTDKEKEATDAGADMVGGDSLIAEIEKGKLGFDVLVASPDMMAKIGKLGRVLGTKGLMPNPKSGTVTQNIGSAVKELKAGRVEFRVDKNGIVHQIIGKSSFDQKKLEVNYEAFLDAIKHAKPSGVKGVYIKSISLSTTMGPGVKVTV